MVCWFGERGDDMLVLFNVQLGVEPKIGGFSPQIIHFDGVFPLFSPSILGCFPVFGNTQLLFEYCMLWASFRSAGKNACCMLNKMVRPSPINGMTNHLIDAQECGFF